MGSATADHFRMWHNREEIRPIPEKYRDAWWAAQLEAKVWNSLDPDQSDHHHLDMRASYLACKDLLMGRVGDAIGLLSEYGFLTSMMHRANMDRVPPSDILSLTGAIQLSTWQFSQHAYPYTVGHVGEHLCENQGRITLLLSSGTCFTLDT